MSVRRIQNLMPQQSTADSSLIHGLMDDGHLFPLVVDLEQRDSLLQRLLKISGRILSLHSLAQDTLLLEPCAKSLHQLVPGSYVNLRHSLLSHFNGGGTDWPIQTAENVTEDVTVDYGSCPALYQSKQASSAYVQLWLFAIRYIESLTDTKLAGGRDDNHNSPHMYQPAKREAIRRLAFLAHRLRFRSKQIKPLRLQNTMKSVTRDFIVTCRPPQLYEYPSKWETDTTNKVVQILNVPRVRNDCASAIPPFSVEDKSNAPCIRERCGLPSSKAHRDNCQSLYIPQIYSPDQPTGTYPSTFAIMRDIFCSFFGRDLFPPDFRFPWWAASVASSPTTESVPHDQVDLTLLEETDPVSPIDLEPHPPGTPMYSNESEEQSEIGFQNLASDIDMPEALVTQPPMAAGFEDEYGVAELNLRAYISHSRGSEEILTLWAQSQNTRLVVFYFFKTREYCKFDIGDREMRAHRRSFVYSIANDHHFATIDRDSLVSISAAQAVEANPGHVVFISTDLEHNEPPIIHLWQYILSFDPKTGKREGDGKDERPKKKGHLSEEL